MIYLKHNFYVTFLQILPSRRIGQSPRFMSVCVQFFFRIGIVPLKLFLEVYLHTYLNEQSLSIIKWFTKFQAPSNHRPTKTLSSAIPLSSMLLVQWILFFIVINSKKIFAAEDERCKRVIAQSTIKDGCQLFDSTEESPISCALNVSNTDDMKATCERQGCCWSGRAELRGCFKKPVKCYVDVRYEFCPVLRGFSSYQIYQGFSMDGTYCFVDTIQHYFETNAGTFGDVTSPTKGIKIFTDADGDKACGIWTAVKVTDYHNKSCLVEYPDNVNYRNRSGEIWARKCVLKYENHHHFPVDIGSNRTCTCRLKAWLEDSEENLSISENIRDFVEKELDRSTCAQILGRLVRKSWKQRIDIVNSAEADVVVQALLNITNEKTADITNDDTDIILDTSEQLSKYKFYERIENDSAKYLIKSTAKVMSNLMKHLNKETETSSDRSRSSNPGRSVRASSPAELQEAHENPKASEKLQWKIIRNLEVITDNVASQIQLPENTKKYVVSAEEESVNLQVAIAKPADRLLLVNLSHATRESAGTSKQEAYVTDFSSYENDENEDNVAVITVFYNLPFTHQPDSGLELKTQTSDTFVRRASNVLAVNLRTLTQGYIQRSLSLPVRFTMARSPVACASYIDSSNTTCLDEPVCAFAEENSEGKTWSTDGCRMLTTKDETVTNCACDHTTHFAVLMQTADTVSEMDTRVLEFLSISLGSISVAALMATTTVFILYRHVLLKDRMLIHMHLIVALMCGYISILGGSVFSKHHFNLPTACFIAAVSTHLFFLSTFFWLLVEGIYLFHKVVLVFSSKWTDRVAKYSSVLGWFCPIVIVIISVAVTRTAPMMADEKSFDPYYSIETCFIQTKNNMIWAFMGPVLLIILINTIILVKVVLVIYYSSLSSSRKMSGSEKDNHLHSLRNSAKGAVILMPILGIPWIINVFVNFGISSNKGYNYGATVAAYVHVVLSGLQGVAIFLFYCVYNSEVRNAYKLSAERRKSLASIESVTKNRKRSRLPLLTSKNNSPESTRGRICSLQPNNMYRTTTMSSAETSPPPSPNMKATLEAVEEDKC